MAANLRIATQPRRMGIDPPCVAGKIGALTSDALISWSGGVEPINLLAPVSRLFETHQVPFHVEGEWVVPLGRLPAIRGTWFPREFNGLLEVEVLLDDERVISECFAGVGEGEEGIHDALQNFCVNSFHVFLSAFWECHDADQVLVEHWQVAGRSFEVFIGNVGTRASAGTEPHVPSDLMKALEMAIKSQLLSPQIHWYRHFFCDVKGNWTFESLYDNEVWATGVDMLRSQDWVKSDGYYSARLFLLMKPSS